MLPSFISVLKPDRMVLNRMAVPALVGVLGAPSTACHPSGGVEPSPAETAAPTAPSADAPAPIPAPTGPRDTIHAWKGTSQKLFKETNGEHDGTLVPCDAEALDILENIDNWLQDPDVQGALGMKYRQFCSNETNFDGSQASQECPQNDAEATARMADVVSRDLTVACAEGRDLAIFLPTESIPGVQGTSLIIDTDRIIDPTYTPGAVGVTVKQRMAGMDWSSSANLQSATDATVKVYGDLHK